MCVPLTALTPGLPKLRRFFMKVAATRAGVVPEIILKNNEHRADGARRLIPIYQEQGHTFQADTCAPLAAAVRRGHVQFAALARGHYPGRKLHPRALPGIKSLGFWDARYAQDWGLDWHRNEGIELTYLECGGLAFAVDRHVGQLKPDDLTITRPWQPHRVGSPQVGAGRLHWLILDVGVGRPHQPWRWPAWVVLTKADLAELTHILRHTERPVWRATPELRSCFQRIAQAVAADRAGSNISRLAAYLNELFVLVLDMCRQRAVPLDASLSSTQRTVALYWDDLRQHPEQLAKASTVDAMAWQCGLGVTHFIHHTKQLFNTTPIQHLNRQRLELAARQLRAQPDRSVLEIALDCGFASSQYFATLFSKHFGCPPRDLRRKAATAPAELPD